MTFRRYPGDGGLLIIVSFIFVTLNTIVDLLYAYVDPRLREDAVTGAANAR